MNIIKYLFKRWKNYRYRFLPWIVLNSNNRSIRYVNETNTDRSSVSQEAVLNLFSRIDGLLKEKPYWQADKQYAELKSSQDFLDWQLTLQQRLGFSIEQRPSQLRDGGLGVFVVNGCVPKDSIVAFYPGTVYYPSEPILLQSIGNRFIFRCADGVFIDGNDSNLSKIIFRSCGHRETLGPYKGCDMTWMTPTPLNPLAVGQYVNNCMSEFAQNVRYHEVTLTNSYPVALRKFLPNVNYSPVGDDLPWSLRLVVLVALRNINKGEELFSSYFTAVV